MRWLVEVTALGKSERESLSVEADSWQKALQAARGQRGDTAPMSGFSIELLDDGCRAVDPMSRLKYEVRKAPAAPAPAPMAAPTPRPAAAPVAMPTPSPVSAAPEASAPATVAPQVIFKREQDPSEAMPLAYREYVYLVAPGTTEAEAEALLSAQFETVRASLDRLPPGKLVNLGVFDVTFRGKPPVPPLATLTWKDWRGAPVVAFPRRAPAPAAAPGAVAAPPQPVAFVPPPAPVFVPPPVPVPPAPDTQPMLGGTAPVPPPPETQPLLGAAPARPSGLARASTPGVRSRGEDLIADLFEAMHELHFQRDAVEGGEFCLSLAMGKLPSRAGLVHLYDIDRREFLITSTRGEGTGALLLRRHAESDPLLLAAMNKRRAVVVADASHAPAANVDRYATLGGVRSLVIAPVMEHGRFLGALELIDPLDGQPFTDVEGNAVTYIAQQFAEFLSSHGVVTDPERISAQRLPGS